MTISSLFTAPVLAMVTVLTAHVASAADGMITKTSKYPVADTIAKFEEAVKSKGWIVFTRIDHAAAAKQVGLEMKPRTVIFFGNPRIGTAPMQKIGTLALDNPPKALVWEDDSGKVMLTFNSGEYIGQQVYPRHGLAMPAEAMKMISQLLEDVASQATQ